MMKTLLKNICLFLFFTSYIASFSQASEAKRYDDFNLEQRARVIEISGNVWVKDQDMSWKPLVLGSVLKNNQTIYTDKSSHIILNFQSNGIIALHQDSVLKIGGSTKQNFQHLHLTKGHLLSFKNPKLDGRKAGLFFTSPNQDQLFHAPRLELEVGDNKTQVFIQKGPLTRIKMALSSPTPEESKIHDLTD